jgi:ribonuclease BN (tRNA processing enzyme)
LAFSGDTEWTDTLIAAGRGADLFICECYQWDEQIRFHLDYQTILANLDRMAPKRVLLSHMSEAMLARRNAVDDPRVLLAQDGLVVDV